MTDYAGDPTSFPTQFPLVSDASPPTASVLNVPLEALADRTAFLKAQTDSLHTTLDLMPYLNWTAVVAPVISGAVCAWEPITQRLLVAGVGAGAPSLFSIAPTGDTSGDFITVAGNAPTDIDVDQGGHSLVSTGGRYGFLSTHDSLLGTDSPATQVDCYGAAIATSNTALCFNSVFGRWIWLATDGTAARVRYSANGTVWSASTAPAGWGSVTRSKVKSRPDTGLAMAVGVGGASFYTAVSTDGGATWVSRATRATTLSSGDLLSLTFDPTSLTWYLVIGSVSGTASVWRSTDDGATWTAGASLSRAAMGQAAVDPHGVLIAPSVIGNSSSCFGIAMSRDQGSTWSLVGVNAYANGPSSGQVVFTGTGFAALLNNGGAGNITVLFSNRSGAPTLAALT